MKHLFAVVREEKTNFMGEIKADKIQRSCVYDPVKGLDVQNVEIKNFDFSGKTWVRNLLGIIGYMSDVDKPMKIFCNKKVAAIGRAMERVISAVILRKETEDDFDCEIIENSIKNGISSEIIDNAKQSKDKLDAFSKIIAVSVMGLDVSDGFTNDELLDIAYYVIKGNRFDNIYYIVDGYDRLKDPSTKQYWMNINAIKTAMLEGIDNHKDEYKDVAPIQVVYAD